MHTNFIASRFVRQDIGSWLRQKVLHCWFCKVAW